MKAFWVILFCVFSLILYSQDAVKGTIPVSVKIQTKSKKSLKVTIDVFDIETQKVVKTLESGGKNTRVPLELGRDYVLVFSRTGYLFQSVSVLLSDSSVVVTEKKLKTIVMEKVAENKKTVLNNLSFDIYQKIAEFESLPDLIYIMKLLESMPQLELEFGGYTCNSGSMTLSLKVSEEKAKTLVDYLVSRGANADRLKYKGYGSFQPVASNYSQEGRILNNRVEMKVIGVNFVSKSPERLRKIDPDSIYREQSAVKTTCSTASESNSTAESNSTSEVKTMSEFNSTSETLFMPGINSNTEANSVPETNTSTMAGVNSAGESTEISPGPGNSNTEVNSASESNEATESTSETGTMAGINSAAETNSASENNTMPGINSSGESTSGTDSTSATNTTAGNTTGNTISGTDSTAETNSIAEANTTSGKDSAKTDQGTKTTGSAETTRSSPLTKDYRGMFIADKKPFANATVNLLTEKGKVYKTTKTDANGRFKFVGVPADKKLTVGLNEKEIKKYKKVKLLDNASEIFGTIDAYFEENSTIVPEDINAMIDYFFDN